MEELRPRLLDIPHAAKFIGGTIHGVRGLLWDGKVPFIRLGKKFLIDVRDLERWIETNKQQNGQ